MGWINPGEEDYQDDVDHEALDASDYDPYYDDPHYDQDEESF